MVWVDDVTFVSDLPGKNDGSEGLGGGGLSTKALIDLIANAKESVYIQTPYLVTTEVSQQLFQQASDRGVEIKILTNSLLSTDNLEAFSGYKREREKLLEIGVEDTDDGEDHIILDGTDGSSTNAGSTLDLEDFTSGVATYLQAGSTSGTAYVLAGIDIAAA